MKGADLDEHAGAEQLRLVHRLDKAHLPLAAVL